VLAWLVLATPAGAAETGRSLNLTAASGVTGGAVAASLLLWVFQDRLAPATCRICASDGLDMGTRQRLVWSEPKAAKYVSDGLAVAIPAAALATAFLSGRSDAGNRRGLEDALVVAESASIAVLGTQIAKVLAARLRPFAAYQTDEYPANTDDHLSFWSGHTAITVAATTSLATVARMRGSRSGPWLLGSGLALSLATGYLRVAADKHWLTDVLLGALWGAAVGVAVPYLHLRSQDGSCVTSTVTPLAGTF
jgi:hypothetical protein